MAKIKVVLGQVKCNDTEDVTGADEFYLAGAVTDGEHVATVLTKPISINDKQTKDFNTGGGTVFEQDVPNDRVLKIVLSAWDEDSNKDWSKYGDMVQKIGSTISGGLSKVPSPYTAAASTVLPIAIGAIGTIMSLDKDDELGKLAVEFPVWSLKDGESHQVWAIKGGSGWYSSWSYALQYTITKS